MYTTARIVLTALALVLFLSSPGRAADTARVAFQQDDAQGQLHVQIDGREAFCYQYAPTFDVPHYYPLYSPSGKLLTVQEMEPYPHHRSFWFSDTVQFASQPEPASFYMAWRSRDPKNPDAGFRHRIRHVQFDRQELTPQGAILAARLCWEADYGKTPMLDEARSTRIVPLGEGEYFLDCTFELKAAYEDVTFKSDPTHYAWPYLRMHPQFSVMIEPTPAAIAAAKEKNEPKPTATKSNGAITNSEGAHGSAETHLKPAHWVDYSATIEGTTEGLTLMADPSQPAPKYFTRDYGCFGPRRPDAQSGVPFVLKHGDALRQHVGILVHRGDASGVAERYRQFAEGKL